MVKKKLAKLKAINQNIAWPEFAVTDLFVGICSIKVLKSIPNSVLLKNIYIFFCFVKSLSVNILNSVKRVALTRK
jgi:hypothetical protein